MRAFYRVAARLVVEASDADAAQRLVESMLKDLVHEENSFVDGQVGDVDEVKQTWERV